MPAKKKPKYPKISEALKGNRRSVGNKGGTGRPTKFDAKTLAQVQKAYKAGFTDYDVSVILKVSETTINRWKIEHPEFLEAITRGKSPVNHRVEQSLFARAVGYNYPAQKIMQNNGEPVIVDYVEHVPPDVTAMQFYLSNRMPEEWKLKQSMDHSMDQKTFELMKQAIDAGLDRVMKGAE